MWWRCAGSTLADGSIGLLMGARSAEEIRQIVEQADPALLRLMDGLRARFGARLVALKGPGVDIGWGKWEAERARAEPCWRFPKDLAEGEAEWERIKAEAIRSGELARRKPTQRKPGVVR